MSVEYNRTNWQNDVTPLNQTNMNNIERGIKDVTDGLNTLSSFVHSKIEPDKLYVTDDTLKEYVKRNELRFSKSGSYIGGYISQERMFDCGFYPQQITISEKNSSTGRVENIYTIYESDDVVTFTDAGFVMVSTPNGKYNKNGYTYLWAAVTEGVNSLPSVSASDDGKIVKVVDGEWKLSDDDDSRGHAVFYGDDIVEDTDNNILYINHLFTSTSPYNANVPIDVNDVVITNRDMTVLGNTYKKGSVFIVTRILSDIYFGEVSFSDMIVDVEAGGVWGEITGTLSNQTDLQTALDGKLSLSGGTITGNVTITNKSIISGSNEIIATGNGVTTQPSIGSTYVNGNILLRTPTNYDIIHQTGNGNAVMLSSRNTSANPTLSGGESEATSLRLNSTNYALGKSVSYLTTAPTSANTSGRLQFVVLSAEPANKYDGYLYIITGA